MEILLIILIVVSAPVFYILGAIEFFRLISGRKKVSDQSNKILDLLREEVNKNPQTTVKKFLEKLKGKSENFVFEVDHAESASNLEIDKKSPTDAKETKSSESWNWDHWYSENSINMLLYIGAFLIVASASIFVGFAWETIGGVTKAITISLLALLFLIAGGAFFQHKKIKNAGSTFMMIGSLLIPFAGMAWYNFVLASIGIEVGAVWLVISIILIVLQLGLAYYTKSKFYAYSFNLASLSLVLSFVNVSKLNSEFYILGAIAASIIMLGTKALISKSKDLEDLYGRPTMISTNIIMPITLLYGFSVAIENSMLGSIEVAVSLSLAAFFYLLSYFIYNKYLYILPSALLFLFAYLSISEFFKIDIVARLYGVQAISIAYLFFANVFKKFNNLEESNINMILSHVVSSTTLLYAITSGFSAINSAIFALILGAISLGGYWIRRSHLSILVAGLSQVVFWWILVSDILTLQNEKIILAIVYLVWGVIYYYIFNKFRKENNLSLIIILLCAINFVLGMVSGFESFWFLAIESILIGGIFIYEAYATSKEEMVYFGNIFFTIATLFILRQFKIDSTYYSLIFFADAVIFYLVGVVSSEKIKNAFIKSGLATSLIFPLAFGTLSLGSVKNNDYLKDPELFALISGILSGVLFSVESLRAKRPDLGYWASAIFMFCYLWILKYMEVTEAQIYALPLALYFFILAYLRRLKDDFSWETFLDYCGLFVLTVVTVIQSFGENGFYYALLFGIEGVILMIIGNVMPNKRYLYTGVAAIIIAVISQTYVYIASLPRWLITGIAGIVFLVTATVLMLKKKEESK